jgi:hypothetical protein
VTLTCQTPRIIRGIAAAAAVALVATVSPSITAQSSLLIVASGLDNPRGLNFGPDGALYVAEAGRGGTSTLCAPAPDPPFPNRCYGPTGAITRILALGDQRRVVVGLPSIAVASGGNAQGPVDIDFGLGSAWVTIGFGGSPTTRAALEAGGVTMGRIVRVNSIGQWEPVVDLTAYEGTANPDGGAIDSNPFGLKLLSDRALVADSGANAVLSISSTGVVSTFAVFPNRVLPPTIQSVPTSIAVAPNGDTFVGELTGVPFVVGAAQVYRVPAGGGTPVAVAGGFTNIIDIALAPNGTGYVLEHDADGIIGPGVDGRVIRINTDGSRTVVAGAGLVKPGGIAVGPDGALYVTTHANTAGNGEVVRIVP